MDIHRKIVLVAGATSGIGEATAIMFARKRSLRHAGGQAGESSVRYYGQIAARRSCRRLGDLRRHD